MHRRFACVRLHCPSSVPLRTYAKYGPRPKAFAFSGPRKLENISTEFPPESRKSIPALGTPRHRASSWRGRGHCSGPGQAGQPGLQLANQCAGFKPPPARMRFGTKQSQRCFLVQGLFSALSVMLGQTASHLILAILTADTTRRATRYCSRTPMLTERAASPVAGSGLLRRGCRLPSSSPTPQCPVSRGLP